jgi:hypothetical protein
MPVACTGRPADRAIPGPPAVPRAAVGAHALALSELGDAHSAHFLDVLHDSDLLITSAPGRWGDGAMESAGDRWHAAPWGGFLR